METAGKVIIGLVIGVIIGFFIGRGMGPVEPVVDNDVDVSLTGGNDSGTTDTPTGTVTPGATSTSTTPAPADREVKADGQKAGGTVLVARVVLDTASWVVVHEDINGSVGAVIGSKLVTAGTNENVSIALTKPTVAGKKYYVMLHINDGLDGFAANDVAMLDANGKTFTSTFTATQ